jgi:hypothetical protein
MFLQFENNSLTRFFVVGIATQESGYSRRQLLGMAATQNQLLIPKPVYHFSQRRLLLAKQATSKTSYSRRQLLKKAATPDSSYVKPATTRKTSYYYSQNQLLLVKPTTRKTSYYYSQKRQLLPAKTATTCKGSYSRRQLLENAFTKPLNQPS